ncbi:MAG TPA: lactoylglutathione lyase [Lutibacter sp.]|nr:lactoylglutathione lyase [Lutibacter sp.]
MQVQFILYVQDQNKSTEFYKNLLDKKPCLFVQGMTEFQLNKNTKLGLMPNDSIAKLIPQYIKHPNTGTTIPRCELYLKVDDVNTCYKKALNLGATPINEPQQRDWGDYVGYVMDLDGHIVAFYSKKII